jgi:hypothetical protein
MDDLGCPAEEGGQLPASSPLGVRLEGSTGGEHDADDRGGEGLAEEEGAPDREEGDDVDAGPSFAEVPKDRDRQMGADDEGRDGPGRPSDVGPTGDRRGAADDEAGGR